MVVYWRAGVVPPGSVASRSMEGGTREKWIVVSFAVTACLLLASHAFSHHSDSIYDMGTLVTVTGTVEQFEFLNPHEIINLDVAGANGAIEKWIVFGSAPAVLAKVGWTKNTIKPGERITITGFQYKDGRKGMLQLKVMRSDGTALPIGEIEKNYLSKGKFQKPKPAEPSGTSSR